MPPISAANPISYAQSGGLPISPKRFQISAPAARKASAKQSPKVCRVSGPTLISGCTWPSLLGEQHLQQRLLRVQPVLGLVPDGGVLAVEDVGGDLLAGVRGQAVQDDGAVLGGGEQVGVELERGEVGAPAGGLLLVAHADPDVRI